MKIYSSKLVIIRGNSGSGKSTIAKLVRDACKQKVAIIEQDYLRRFILKEKEKEGTNNIDLIYKTVIFALSRNYNVILEGILNFSRYGKIIKKLIGVCPDYHVFYLDVSLNETLKRHQTKPNKDEFGEKEIKRWYKFKDTTNIKGEICIPESYILERSVKKIIMESGLF